MRETSLGLVELVVRRALMVWALGMVCLLPISARAAAGVTVGGGISVGMVVLYRALVNTWVRPDRWRRGRFALLGVWLVKWPVVGALLYFAMKDWQVSPLWLCAGVGLVPAVVTAVAVWVHFRADWETRAALEGK